jgi:RND superfamily putative drug exporter
MKTRIIQNEAEQPAQAPDTSEPAPVAIKSARNAAARAGRWSASHKKLAIIGWLVFVAVAFVGGNALKAPSTGQNPPGPGESGHVDRILTSHFKQPQGDTVLIQSTGKTVGDAPFTAAIRDVARTVAAIPQVKQTRSPLTSGNEDLVSSDRHSALVTLKLRTTDQLKARVLDAPVEKALTAVAARHPGIAVEEFGVNADKQLNEAVGKDFVKAGVFSVPVTLIVLVIAFGAMVAAGLPLLLALTAVLATMGLLGIPSRLMPLDPNTGVVVLLIGLAVGVDYSLFYLKRERGERAAGRGERAAIEAAAATSGRSVLVSGITVMVAMAGMLLTRDQTFMSFGIATMIVVAVAVLGSITVLPALLAALGSKVDRGHLPFLHKLRRPDRGGRTWSRVIDRVMRRPAISLVLAAGVLLALAAPALHMHVATPGFNTLPQNLSSVKTYNKLQKAFPGAASSAQVLVSADNVRGRSVSNAIAALQHQAIATGRFSTPTTVDYSPDGTIALVSLAVPGEGTDAKSLASLATLRNTVIPATVGRLAGADVAVTGTTAREQDGNSQMKRSAPLVFAFVLGLAFLLMLLTFRSIVIAAKTVVLNVLSVAAAYGALVLVFQHGWGKGVLGFDMTTGIVGFLPIFLFVVLFGLSMDYHVFILSRVREAHDGGMSTNEAVAHGIKSTAGVVTSAALVMVGVFSIFATLQFMFLKQFGVGLAVAVLIDATIVRGVLLPAAMTLAGDWNWYLPKWLEWLPRIEGRNTADVPAAPPSALVPTP